MLLVPASILPQQVLGLAQLLKFEQLAKINACSEMPPAVLSGLGLTGQFAQNLPVTGL
jgi:hypothetical protein